MEAPLHGFYTVPNADKQEKGSKNLKILNFADIIYEWSLERRGPDPSLALLPVPVQYHTSRQGDLVVLVEGLDGDVRVPLVHVNGGGEVVRPGEEVDGDVGIGIGRVRSQFPQLDQGVTERLPRSSVGALDVAPTVGVSICNVHTNDGIDFANDICRN